MSDTAFSAPFLVLDVIRVLLVGAGLFLAGVQILLVRDSPAWGQKARIAAISVALLILSAGRFEHLGTPVTWELWGTIVLIVLVGYGSWAWFRERPAQTRKHGR
jgi:hypothetical protein